MEIIVNSSVVGITVSEEAYCIVELGEKWIVQEARALLARSFHFLLEC